MLRRVVREPTTVGAVLSALAVPTTALREGRVFVGRRRATSLGENVPAGEELLVHDAAATVALPEPFVLHDRDGVLMVDKPAGMPTIPDQKGSAHSLLHRAAEFTRRDPSLLHPTSRLDRDVSGVVTFAVDGAAATALRLAREEGAYQRLYVALGAGALAVERARWEWSLAQDRAPRVHKAVAAGQKGALPAASRVAVAATHGAYLALALAPETGRTHQLRVHAAAAGVPLVGDRIYGGPGRITTSTGAVRVPGRIALHCARVDIALPGGHVSASSPIPPELAELAAFLGLDLTEALRCAP
ncbi:MAG: hypothetical protein IPJ34_11000 [Myxococcales bacterium]|nr:hypothetical protein [Myxococcales bacterium]